MSATGATLSTRLLAKRQWKKRKTCRIAFLDLNKAFVQVSHETIFRALRTDSVSEGTQVASRRFASLLKGTNNVTSELKTNYPSRSESIKINSLPLTFGHSSRYYKALHLKSCFQESDVRRREARPHNNL